VIPEDEEIGDSKLQKNKKVKTDINLDLKIIRPLLGID
jgi:hypothetical protein